MENKRETILFKTENHEFEIKSWLTAREERAINQVIFQHVKFNPSMKASDARDGKGMAMNFNEVPATLTQDQQNETMNQFIVSMDGKSENILERALDMRSKEFETLTAKISEIQNGGLES